jgi:hypothetical protein
MIEIKVRKETLVVLRECSKEALDSFGSLESPKVNGGLYLVGCTGLTKLPDGLTVGGNLSLYYCAGLKKLPDGLTVGGLLNLRNCTGITKLPKDLHLIGVIYYNSDTGFYIRVHVPGVIPKHLKCKLRKY